MEKGYKRIDAIDSMIKVVGEDREMDAEARDKLMRDTPLSIPSVQYRGGGGPYGAPLRALVGIDPRRPDDRGDERRWDRVMKRAAEHMGTTAEVTTPVAGGFGGVFVAPVVGPVIDTGADRSAATTGVGEPDRAPAR